MVAELDQPNYEVQYEEEDVGQYQYSIGPHWEEMNNDVDNDLNDRNENPQCDESDDLDTVTGKKWLSVCQICCLSLCVCTSASAVV